VTGDLFTRVFGRPAPDFAVSVPGRVNLIGEHIDYAGLSVLPMAVQRRISLWVRARDDEVVCIVNGDPRYGRVDFVAGTEIPPFPTGHWGNYVKAAVQHLARRYGCVCGFDAFVASDLPAAMGLSSSSALVVGVALSALTAAGREVSALELASELAEAERYVGTRGGGMDQAICLVARSGHASRIDFGPLADTPTPVPAEWRFIVASSLASAEKSGRVQREYNDRRKDVEHAVRTVAAAVGMAGAPLEAVLSQCATDEVLAHGACLLDGTARPRFRHVVREAARVHGAERALRESDPLAFGGLMLASHASLRDDFEVSTEALDAIVRIASDAGAFGARLTGAGFGGCAVMLASAATEQRVREALAADFYAPRGVADPASHLFVAEPSAGATVRRLP
jgi:galactokinase